MDAQKVEMRSDLYHENTFWSLQSTRPAFLKGGVMRERESCCIEYRGVWWPRPWAVKPAHEPVSACAKPRVPLKSAPETMAIRGSGLTIVGRNQAEARNNLSLKILLVLGCDSRLQGFSTPLARRRSSYPPSSTNLMTTHPAVHAATRLRGLRRPIRLSATV